MAKNKHAVALGSITSPRKAAAAKKNALLGGAPIKLPLTKRELETLRTAVVHLVSNLSNKIFIENDGTPITYQEELTARAQALRDKITQSLSKSN